jgi:hypothetical protein
VEPAGLQHFASLSNQPVGSGFDDLWRIASCLVRGELNMQAAIVKGVVAIAAVSVCCLAYPQDGRLEINQACALNGGCFSGDSAGFPVTITSPGSYQLTGNLDLSTLPLATAIQVEAPAVNLDLGGFQIIGPTNCTDSGGSIACDPPGGGNHGVSFFSAAVASSLSNGTIRGFNNGVSSNPEGLRIRDVTAISNSNDGFSIAASAMINDCVAITNGGDGFDGDAGSVFQGLMAFGNGINGIEIDNVGGVVSGSTSRGNGGSGFNVVAMSRFGQDNESWGNLSPDTCSGGICAEKQRYYLTPENHQGADVLTACVTGFHTAALWEIKNTSFLIYDHVLGVTGEDTGLGPPSGGSGWVRNGFTSRNTQADEFVHGIANCSAWTSSSADDVGIRAFLALWWRTNFAADNKLNGVIEPWGARNQSCSTPSRVWCVEDR